MRKRICALILTFIMLTVPLISCSDDQDANIRLRDLTWAVSTSLPRAEDFVVSLPDGYSVAFTEKYTFRQIGRYTLKLTVTDKRGRESIYTVHLDLVVDDVPPTITGLQDLAVALGHGVSYLSGVEATDNCDGEVTLSVDASEVDLRTVGVYPVYYTATDAAGNTATFRMSLTVYEREITEEMLWEELDPIIDQIISNGMTTVQKLEQIYEYVYDHVSYVSTSDKTNWVRAAYEGLTTHRGDCYTYFALSKAFFERLEIENLDVQRDASVVALVDERHFWNLVNIGTDAAPRWYHFDACHIKDLPKPWGFLMTDEQLAAYTAKKVNANGIGNYFYAFDSAGYPATPTQKMNNDY